MNYLLVVCRKKAILTKSTTKNNGPLKNDSLLVSVTHLKLKKRRNDKIN